MTNAFTLLFLFLTGIIFSGCIEPQCLTCDVSKKWYLDADGDGFGDINREAITSTSPVGIYTALNNADCDDSNAAINPDAQELIDGVDNNCDGMIQIIDPQTGQVFPEVGYTKIGNDGIILADQNQAWNVNGSEAEGTQWSCVRDNETGLYWEVKTNDGGLRDKDWRYTWYDSNPATNGGEAGIGDTGFQITTGFDNQSGTFEGSDNCQDESRCDIEKYIDDVNATQLCGFDDWRLPTGDGSQDGEAAAQELQSLLNCQGYSLLNDAEQANSDCDSVNAPLTENAYFPNTPAFFYWTSSTFSGVNHYAWGVPFGSGNDSASIKASAAAVRLIRSSEQ